MSAALACRRDPSRRAGPSGDGRARVVPAARPGRAPRLRGRVRAVPALRPRRGARSRHLPRGRPGVPRGPPGVRPDVRARSALHLSAGHVVAAHAAGDARSGRGAARHDGAEHRRRVTDGLVRHRADGLPRGRRPDRCGRRRHRAGPVARAGQLEPLPRPGQRVPDAAGRRRSGDPRPGLGQGRRPRCGDGLQARPGNLRRVPGADPPLPRCGHGRSGVRGDDARRVGDRAGRVRGLLAGRPVPRPVAGRGRDGSGLRREPVRARLPAAQLRRHGRRGRDVGAAGPGDHRGGSGPRPARAPPRRGGGRGGDRRVHRAAGLPGVLVASLGVGRGAPAGAAGRRAAHGRPGPDRRRRPASGVDPDAPDVAAAVAGGRTARRERHHLGRPPAEPAAALARREHVRPGRPGHDAARGPVAAGRPRRRVRDVAGPAPGDGRLRPPRH